MLSASHVISNLGFIVRPLYRVIAAEIARGQPGSIPLAREHKVQAL
jgi:hypothetical protein